MILLGSLFSGICSEYFCNIGETEQVFAADNDRFVGTFLRNNVRPRILVDQDLATYDVATLPYVDVFLAGAPCQPFSSIGTSDPDDPRTELYQAPLRYARSKKPKYFIFENVPPFQRSPSFHRLVRALQRLYRTVNFKVLDAARFGSIQRRKRLFIVASDVPFSFPEGKDGRPPPFVASVLDPPSTDFQYLSEKGKAYLDRRKKWGVRIYRRKDRAFLGTLPRSYGHMQSWKHTIDEGNERLRNLTPSEAFRIQSFDPSRFDCTGLSRRQLMYMAGNAIDRKMLEALLRSILGKSPGNIVP